MVSSSFLAMSDISLCSLSRILVISHMINMVSFISSPLRSQLDICIVPLQFCTFFPVLNIYKTSLMCILKARDVTHARAMCEKMFFLCYLSMLVPSSPLTHVHTPTYTSTCIQPWLLKVLTWAKHLCQLFPVGRLSTCFYFHEGFAHESL